MARSARLVWLLVSAGPSGDQPRRRLPPGETRPGLDATVGRRGRPAGPAREHADAEGTPDRCDEADARIRTADPFITSEVLYQLSYVGA